MPSCPATSPLLSQTTRLASVSRPFNLVVTNVPGPQFPLYFLGARLLECYPVVPIFHYQALGIALFSYDGRLFWGFNADWDAVRDLHDLVGLVDDEFRRLVAAPALDDSRGYGQTSVPAGFLSRARLCDQLKIGSCAATWILLLHRPAALVRTALSSRRP